MKDTILLHWPTRTAEASIIALRGVVDTLTKTQHTRVESYDFFVGALRGTVYAQPGVWLFDALMRGIDATRTFDRKGTNTGAVYCAFLGIGPM